ncbi:AraC family transcriptional regulator [Paenibacillus sp. YPG26]|uniref:AraC family transcriptional regulator n=1 Tax=Paenibacillus sp. YPG26 TaxID=2878915 RepID=UPI00203E83B4|nr:AraC family transcriptional regulator [Paenibacillus sp. YPG26]USB34326.1 AraC family transcriptional regulator [Paenibacillus sp. YPG26]
MLMNSETYNAAANPLYSGTAELHVLFSGESQTPPNHHLGPKVYNFYLFHFVEKGRGTYRTEFSAFDLKAGEGFLIHPDQLVSYVSDPADPWRYRWIAFAGTGADELVLRAGFRLEQPVLRSSGDSAIPGLLKSVLRAFRKNSSHADLTSLGCLYMIMAEAEEKLRVQSGYASGKSRVQQVVKQMIQYMSSQYAYPVSIEQMSASMGYNRAYLSRIFKQQIGVSPVSYLLQLRMDKARELLRDRPELSIEQVAASVGLPDALYFSRQFSRLQGRSPSSYRKSVSEAESTDE